MKYPGKADAEASFLVPYYMMEEIDYRDSSPWPVAADGQGSSLQRRHFGEFGNDPQNWRADRPQKLSGPDVDNDQIDDSWEILHGLIVGLDDAGLDPDRDLRTNLEEFLARTLPFDATSYLHLSIQPTATGLSLHLTAAPEVAYTILETDTLTVPLYWSNFVEIDAEPVERELEIEIDTAEPRRFFRVIISPR